MDLKENPENTSLPKPCNKQQSPMYAMMYQLEARQPSRQQILSEIERIQTAVSAMEVECARPLEVGGVGDAQLKARLEIHEAALHEYFDFFLAANHPTVRDKLEEMESEYKMLDRMWRYGLLLPLELLRNSPGSREHLLTYIHAAYGTLTSLYEEVPTFSQAWTRRLGDFAKYRMLLESGDGQCDDRKIWAEISASWYGKE
ncbi:hypothetical protein HIM_09679 [Hirsutella minnesotensis 3608]|uniref:Uncharacterized protein n=1 Tax=Hirsutella minnesotensis 3608 TaxID=1043627 RepID=A0A0F7ZS86_9HYPO|nr:hypothetical protein HIM_09679 [Hirsutella minnesotensis 3608]